MKKLLITRENWTLYKVVKIILVLSVKLTYRIVGVLGIH